MTALERHLLNAYLDGDLDEEAAAAFECLILERPDLAEVVEADAALHIGLNPRASRADAAEDERAAAPPAETEPNDATNLFARSPGMPAAVVLDQAVRRRYKRLRWLPIAAAVVVALSAAGYLVGRRSPGIRAVAVAYVDKERGAVDGVRIDIPRDHALLLRVPVAAAATCLATVRVFYADGASLDARAQSDEAGYANVLVADEQLHAGKAIVSVVCDSRTASYPVEFLEDAGRRP